MKKKLVVKLIIIGIIPLLFVFFISRILQTADLKKKTAEVISVLQPFTAYQNGKPITFDKANITKKYVVLAYVSTDCEHCDYMTEELKKHSKDFRNCTIVMLAMGTEQSLTQFIEKHNLTKVNDISILWDKEFKIRKQFAVTATPEFFIYNKAGQNVLHINGETKIENLLKAVEPHETD